MKQKLLLLHGAIGSMVQLHPLAELLNKDFQIFQMNFSGHGGEDIPDTFSIGVFAEDVLNFLNDNGIGRISIFGYSMGGYVALYLAAHHPERVGKVFTLATKFEWSTESAEKESKMLDPEKIADKLPAFAKALESRHAPLDWKQVLQKTAAMMLEMGRAGPPLTEKVLHKIDHDIKAALGDSDKIVTVTETEWAVSNLKKAKILLLENTPHPIEQVDTEGLVGEIRKFFV